MNPFLWLLWGLLALALLGVGSAVVTGIVRGIRPPRCPQCGHPETEDRP